MLKVKLFNEHAVVPTVAHSNEDLAYDVYASETVELRQGIATKVPCGIGVQFIPDYDWAKWLPPDVKFGFIVRDRSSMAGKGIFTTGGVIDAGYTGELTIFLTDQVSRGIPYIVNRGAKIAQILPYPVFIRDSHIKIVDNLDESSRGEKGFGSTGNSVKEPYKSNTYWSQY